MTYLSVTLWASPETACCVPSGIQWGKAVLAGWQISLSGWVSCLCTRGTTVWEWEHLPWLQEVPFSAHMYSSHLSKSLLGRSALLWENFSFQQVWHHQLVGSWLWSLLQCFSGAKSMPCLPVAVRSLVCLCGSQIELSALAATSQPLWVIRGAAPRSEHQQTGHSDVISGAGTGNRNTEILP